MHKKNGYNKKLAVTVLFLGIIFVFSLFLFTKPQITGFVVYGEDSYVKNWSFNNADDYVYNNSLIVNDDVKLAPIITFTYWNTSNEINYSITAALYNPSDKTEKVNALDNEKQEIDDNKLLDIFFNESLENGDIISLYINEGDEGNIYLCDKGNLCEASNYGSVSYDEEEGWYNIPINGLNSPTKIFNLNPPDDVKVNLINSTKGGIVKALYKPSDKTSKVQDLDDNKFEVNKAKLFNLIFDNQINNDDIVSIYAKSGSASEIYLCGYGEECTSPGYGSVNYDGEEGWYNITVNGLAAATDSFNLDPDKVKIDYIKAIHTKYEQHNSSNTTYATSAEIETEDLEIENLLSFNIFSKNELLNSQSITYQYSTDSGGSWNEIPEDGNLSEINASNSKIRIKAVLNSDEITTPILYDMAVSYFTQIIVCTENWEAAYSDCLTNDTKLKTYTDSNNCGTGDGLPADNGSHVSCDYCTPNWLQINTSCQSDDTKTTSYYDDDCYTQTGLESDNNPPANQTVSCDYCTPNWIEHNTSCQPDNILTSFYNDNNSCYAQTGLELDNNPPTNKTYSCDYCTPNWSCISYRECQLNNIKKCTAIEDNNSCYNLTNLTLDTYSGNYNEFNLNCVYNKTGIGFNNLSVSLIANEITRIDKTNSTDAVLELNVSDNLENNFVSIMKYSENKKNTSPSSTALGKYLDIEADNSLKNNINSVKIRIYYTDEEINNTNLKEGTLKIYYYNETSSIWQELNSTVNTTENYVLVEVDHLSTYGLFGEQKHSESSSGSSGGGGGSGRIIKKTPEKEEEKTPTLVEGVKEDKKTAPETIPAIEEKIVCGYDLGISLPDEISLVEKDFIEGKIKNKGNCNISEVKIDVSPNLIDIIDGTAFIIKNLKENQMVDFILNKKSSENRTSLLVQGFNIFRAKEIKNFKGELSIKVLENNDVKKEIKVPLNVEVSAREDIKNTIPLFVMISMFVVTILFVVFRNKAVKK